MSWMIRIISFNKFMESNESILICTHATLRFAFNAKGILVFSAICISSTETIGGISMGFFAKNGKLIAVIKIKTPCKTEDMIMLLFTF